MNRAQLQQALQDAFILAPLTKGGNLPFRRLCVEEGADITVSEMVYARYLLKGEARERALIRRHPSERCFGVQMAALQTEEALKAAKIIEGSGADFIDINCGCPIDEVTRRGLGAALLRRPNALFRLVEHLSSNLSIPVTVKIRTGYKEGEINALEIAKGVESAGAAALTVHGRTREQRYSRAADWELIGKIRASVSIPVVGNGDILTQFEAADRREISSVAGMMIARGALIKPWIFRELKEGRDLPLDGAARLAVYWRFTQHLKEHFRDDEKGRRRIMGFLPWHFGFFSRYQPFDRERDRESSRLHPLIQTRASSAPFGDPLERVLNDGREATWNTIAAVMLDAPSEDSAAQRIAELQEHASVPASEEAAPGFEERVVNG